MGKRLVVGALIVDDAEHPSVVLAARRSTPPAGRWEFPGGKVEHGETPQGALVREIREELGVVVHVGRRLDQPSSVRWPISESLEMELWWCTVADEPGPGDSHDDVRWLGAGELQDIDWLPSDRGAIPLVAARLRENWWSVAPCGNGEGDDARQNPGRHQHPAASEVFDTP